MARSRSQTAPGKAVYRLNTDLRVPSKNDPAAPRLPSGFAESAQKYEWKPKGSEVTADELEGLNLPALEKGDFIKKIADTEYQCEVCQEHGTKAEKEKRYRSLHELRDHYTTDHKGLAAPAEEG